MSQGLLLRRQHRGSLLNRDDTHKTARRRAGKALFNTRTAA
jgi:hypothetical protein